MRHIWLYVTALAFTVVIRTDAQAAVINAATCSSADVQTAINSAKDGDTVAVPAGSCTWTRSVTTNKAITLQAVGAVALIGNLGSTGDMFLFQESTAGPIRITGFTFPRPAADSSGTRAAIRVSYTVGGRPVVVDNNSFTGASNSPAAVILESTRGVFYRNTITSGGLSTNIIWEAFKCKAGALSATWSSTSTMGNADTTGESNAYFETNTIINVRQSLDMDDNCRIVVRNNTFTNSDIVSHGQETSPHGVRHFEIYNNTWVWDDTPCPALDPQTAIYLRGGTGVITGNTIPDLRVCGSYWGDKPEIGMVVQNLRRNSPVNGCWGTLTPGSYPAPRQIGQSHNGRSFVTDPVYIWNNPGLPPNNPAVRDYPQNECGTSAPSVETYVIQSRDYVLGPKPGYTPYPYPHPLASGTPGSTNPAPAPPGVPAPSNLIVR
jgi:hypothetical protein